MKTSVKYFCLAVGPKAGTTSQNSQKPTPYMMSLTKNMKPKTKNFFHCCLGDLLNLEGLNSSLAQSAAELCCC